MRETTDLPPASIETPAAWAGELMAKHPDRWLVELDPRDVAELELAATSFLAGSRDISGLTKADFPLPRLAGHLAAEMIEREFERVAHVLADDRCRPAESGDKTDLDRVPRRRGLSQRQSRCACEPKCRFHQYPSSVLIIPRRVSRSAGAVLSQRCPRF